MCQIIINITKTLRNDTKNNLKFNNALLSYYSPQNNFEYLYFIVTEAITNFADSLLKRRMTTYFIISNLKLHLSFTYLTNNVTDYCTVLSVPVLQANGFNTIL